MTAKLYSHILLPTDGSDLANKAVLHGIEIAKAMGAHVTALAVRPLLQDFIAEGVAIHVTDEDRQKFIENTDKHLDVARKAAAEHGVELRARQVENSDPWKAIVATAEELGVDLIVMASHGRRGISALLLGSETQKVLTHSKIPVLVYR